MQNNEKRGEKTMILTVPALIALFCLLYMLLGMRLGRRWGVDKSRMTPAAETGRAKSAVLLLVRDVAVYAYLALEACRNMEASLPVLICLAAMVVLNGVTGYAALFVSVRHEGKGVSMAAYWEIGRTAEKAYHLLSLAVCLPALALMLRSLYGLSGMSVPLQAPALLFCALLCGLSALQNAQLTAGQLANEGDACALSMGGVLIAGLMAAAAVLGGGWASLLGRLTDERIAAAVCVAFRLLASLCALLVLARLTQLSLRGLLRRGIPSRKKMHPAARNALELTAIAAAAAGCTFAMDWTLWVCACASVLLALMSLLICALWLHRIGRGLL